VATTYPSAFQSDKIPADGVLDMGYESLSRYGASPVIQTLVSQGQVSTSVFSSYFAESGLVLYIGGTNRTTTQTLSLTCLSPHRYLERSTTVPSIQHIAGLLTRLIRRFFCQWGDCCQWRGYRTLVDSPFVRDCGA
jgi:hypothetical protein